MTRHFFLRAFAAAATALLLASAPVAAQVAPSLGQAEDFAVLGGSAITNTGPTIVFGDVGISPGTAVSGFPPGVYNGTLHVADANAQGGQNDLVTAYDVAAGQPFDVDLSGQDLGGMTLTPGVYRFASSAQLTGTLTLDAQGDPAAVFIFQIGSTLTTASNAQVTLVNGAAGCNVFWQVGSSATLGTTTSFIGHILALTSITLNTGASVAGNLLARNGAVTLDSNLVTPCSAAGTVCTALTVSPESLPAPVAGQAYAQQLTASGGTSPYVFVLAAGALPPGLSLSPDGLLSGAPTGSGSFAFTVDVSDANGCAGTQDYTLVLGSGPPPAGPPTGAVTIPAVPPLGLLLLAGLMGALAWFSLRRPL